MGIVVRVINNVTKLFKSNSNRNNLSSRVQTRNLNNHPFTSLNDYVPLKAEYELYKVMREAVPLLDTAINRIVRLVGKFDIECEDEKDREVIREFIENIKVNSNQTGMDAFVESYLDQLIECGNSTAEIVLNNAKNDIYALRNVDVRSIKLKTTDNPLINIICQDQGKMEPVELPYQDLILFTPLDPEGDSAYGVSLFRSMPFMTGILLKVFSSIDKNWEKFGNPRYSIVYKPGSDNLTDAQVTTRFNLMQEEFQKVMDSGKGGDIRDFVGIGDIQIQVIGADNQVLDSEVPVKQILEQLVAKTGLPPFLLGLSWSTTERMSQQQADFLTSELDNYRDEVVPMIKQVIDKWQQVTGKNIPYKVVWDEINLQDAEQQAKADVYKQQARGKEIENVMKLRNENIIDQDKAAIELGYDEPVGERPTFFMPENNEESTDDSTKSKHIHSKSCSCKGEKAYDEMQLKIEERTTAAYMKVVESFQEKVLNIIPIIEDSQKSMKKELSDEARDKLDKAVEDFVKDMVGDKDGLTVRRKYGVHGEYLLYAFEHGLDRASETLKKLFNLDDGVKVTPNYNHPYVQELLQNGMETVTSKMKDKREEILNIMSEHAAVGDNPVEWAKDLQNKLSDSITGERWHWERLARSESAMGIDRAEMAEYMANDFNYVEWDIAPDACPICQDLAGQMWNIENAPRVVLDTHSNCRCRKLPRTKKQYQEYIKR